MNTARQPTHEHDNGSGNGAFSAFPAPDGSAIGDTEDPGQLMLAEAQGMAKRFEFGGGHQAYAVQ